MYDLVGDVRSLLKLEDVRIDNNVFRLHYKVTMITMVVFSLINTSRQYIGDPIDCIADGIPQNIMDTYCWITATFTLPNKKGTVGRDLVAPGVSNHVEGVDEIKHHKYYQWVCFVLFFQAILFYVPRYMWKNWEGGRARTLVSDLKMVSLNEEEMTGRCGILCDYFIKNMGYHTWYFTHYVICECLNLVNVIGQMFLMDRFLGWEFSTYGLEVLNVIEMETRVDPMSRVFPKIAKCTFHQYGSSGTIQKTDGLCILSVNVVNEKMYVFIWFWFIALTVITSLALLYRMATILSRRLRFNLLRTKYRTIPPKDLEFLCQKFSVGDWFIFYQMSFNVDPHMLKLLTKDLVNSIHAKENGGMSNKKNITLDP